MAKKITERWFWGTVAFLILMGLLLFSMSQGVPGQSVSRRPVFGQPSEIAGLKLWLKSDTILLLDGNLIDTWEDQSGNANHATQGNSSMQPSFQTNEINGFPMVQSDGASRMNLASALTLSDGFTIYVVGYKPASTILIVGNRISQAYGTMMIFSDGYVYTIDDTNGATATFYTGGHGNIIARWQRADVSSTVTFRSTGMAETNVSIAGNFTFNEMLARSPVPQYTTAGNKFGEILIWNVALTGPQQLTVESYLKSRYNLTF